MATIEEMLNKKSLQRKPFKKISYKPWESSFLSNNDEFATLQDEDKPKSSIEGEGGSVDYKKFDSEIEQNVYSSLDENNVIKSIVNNYNVSNECCEVNKSIDTNLDKHLTEEETSSFDDIYSGQVYPLLEEKKESNLPPFQEKKNHNSLFVSPEMKAELLSRKPTGAQKSKAFRVESLSGIPRLIMFGLIKKEEYRDEHFVYFEAVNKGELAEMCNTVINSVATSIARLKERGCLFSIEGKRGRGGYSVYSMPLFIFNEIEIWTAKNIS
jgi:hypothetical protein